MIETKIPKDIRSYKTKVFGPLTFRQMICCGIAIAVDILMFFITSMFISLSVDFIVYFLIIVDVPILALSFEIQGVPMEKFLISVVTKMFFYPTRRKIKCTQFEEPTKSYRKNSTDKVTDKSKLEKKIKTNPEFKPYK